MSILDALKNLVIKRGGTPKGSNIAEVIDDLAETSSGGGGSNVVIVDLSELPVEHGVDAIPASTTGEVVTFEKVYLFNVDPNKYYIFKNVVEQEGIFGDLYYLSASSAICPFRACEDTSSEQWIEGKTFSDAVDITMVNTLNALEGSISFAPTSTQFKTYKKAKGR